MKKFKSSLPMFKEQKKKIEYKKYLGKPTGYLDWYYSDPRSSLPIRDVTKRKGKNKKEPNYEKGTFNEHASCNVPLLNGAIKLMHGYIFFFTEFKGKYLITGYYKISGITKKKIIDSKGERYAIKADQVGFYSAKDSYPLQKLFSKPVRNPRWVKPKHLTESQTKEILDHFKNKINKRKEYIRLTKKFFSE